MDVLSRDNLPIQVLTVFDHMASSGVCAVCPTSVLCVFAVSGRWRSKAWFSVFSLVYQPVGRTEIVLSRNGGCF